MAGKTVKKGLGKGLDALFFDNTTTSSSGTGAEMIKLSDIEPNRKQPRKSFEDEPLSQLADSIREHGLIQPLLVRPLQKGGYQIIAGERRWRASRMAGLTEVPVIIKDVDDAKTMELALIENLQRENLNAIEEALGYRELMDNFSMTQADVSKSVGKSRSAVANTLRLLNLPKKVMQYVSSGSLSSGHARALLAFESEEELLKNAEDAVKNGLTVRDIERLSQKSALAVTAEEKEKEKAEKKAADKFRDSFFSEMEISLQNELSRKVRITANATGKGTLELAFYDKEDLKKLVSALAK